MTGGSESASTELRAEGFPEPKFSSRASLLNSCLCGQNREPQPASTQFIKFLLSTCCVPGSLIKSEPHCSLSAAPPRTCGAPAWYSGFYEVPREMGHLPSRSGIRRCMGVWGALERRRGSWETEHWGVGRLESQMLFSSFPPCLLLSVSLLLLSSSLADRLPLRVEVQKHPTSIRVQGHMWLAKSSIPPVPLTALLYLSAHVAFEVLSLASYWDEQ